MYLLKDLWYGNIRPNEQFTRRTSQYKELAKAASNAMEQLQKKLTPEATQLLEDYCNQHTMLACLCEENAFTYGVQLGIRFMLDAMDGVAFPDSRE